MINSNIYSYEEAKNLLESNIVIPKRIEDSSSSDFNIIAFSVMNLESPDRVFGGVFHTNSDSIKNTGNAYELLRGEINKAMSVSYPKAYFSFVGRDGSDIFYDNAIDFHDSSFVIISDMDIDGFAKSEDNMVLSLCSLDSFDYFKKIQDKANTAHSEAVDMFALALSVFYRISLDMIHFLIKDKPVTTESVPNIIKYIKEYSSFVE